MKVNQPQEYEAIFRGLSDEKRNTLKWIYEMCEFILKVGKDHVFTEKIQVEIQDETVLGDIIIFGRKYLTGYGLVCRDYEDSE